MNGCYRSYSLTHSTRVQLLIPPCTNAMTLIAKCKRLLHSILHTFFGCGEKISSDTSALVTEQQQNDKKTSMKTFCYTWVPSCYTWGSLAVLYCCYFYVQRSKLENLQDSIHKDWNILQLFLIVKKKRLSCCCYFIFFVKSLFCSGLKEMLLIAVLFVATYWKWHVFKSFNHWWCLMMMNDVSSLVYWIMNSNRNDCEAVKMIPTLTGFLG